MVEKYQKVECQSQENIKRRSFVFSFWYQNGTNMEKYVFLPHKKKKGL